MSAVRRITTASNSGYAPSNISAPALEGPLADEALTYRGFAAADDVTRTPHR